jgi:Flp pilus assembly protein TadB
MQQHFPFTVLLFFALFFTSQLATAGSTPAVPQTQKPSKVQQWLLKKALKKQQRTQQNPKKKARWERRMERRMARHKEKDTRPMHWSTKVSLILLLGLILLPYFWLPMMGSLAVSGIIALFVMVAFSIVGIVKSGKNKLYRGKGWAVAVLIFPFLLSLLMLFSFAA